MQHRLDEASRAAIVDALFRLMLGRPAEPGACKLLGDSLQQGQTVVQLASGIAASAEFRAGGAMHGLAGRLGLTIPSTPAPAPTAARRIFDAVIYNGEIDILLIRLNELADIVHRFVIVEGALTFAGHPRTRSFNPRDPRIAPFLPQIRFVWVDDTPPTTDPWAREAWQRNAVRRGLGDAAPNDLLILADADEIPSARTVAALLHSNGTAFGLQLAMFYFKLDYRNVDGPEVPTICAVAVTAEQLAQNTPDRLRTAIRYHQYPARTVPDAGWHFSYLSDVAGVRRKIAAFSHQELNHPDFLAAIDIPALIDRRADLFARPGYRWEIVDQSSLPAWVQANHRALAPLFCAAPHADRLPAPAPIDRGAPIVLCPYTHAADLADVRRAFRLDASPPPFEAFFWHDADRIGPERAFQHCWDQFPHRDVIILHTDMSPTPGDTPTAWFDALVAARDADPGAGIIACTLFHPQPDPRLPSHVECAGGVWRDGKISYLHGAVPAALLAQPRDVDWATFGAVLIRRDVIRACGPIDPRYRWAYYMDVDYCMEARLRGFRILQIPAALWHEGSRSTVRATAQHPGLVDAAAMNRRAFHEKWSPLAAALPSVVQGWNDDHLPNDGAAL